MHQRRVGSTLKADAVVQADIFTTLLPQRALEDTVVVQVPGAEIAFDQTSRIGRVVVVDPEGVTDAVRG